MRVLNSSLALSEILEYILTRACGLLDTQTAAMYKLDPVSSRMAIQVARGLDDDLIRMMSMPIGKGPAGRAASLRQPFVSNDLPTLVREDFSDSPEQISLFETYADSIKCMLAMPVMLKDEIYGALMLIFPEQREFSAEDIELLSVIGDQAALAIENARLRTDSARVAAVAERSRLARELHDSVSQALYGIALGTRTARELIDSAPSRAAEPLDYVLTLVQGGLAEMRALIFELRPESLATEGLVAAFKKQADALCSRHGIDVVLEQVEEPQLDLDGKEALYRIALEAIQNTIKHAHATRVGLRLTTHVENESRPFVRLQIEDNGRGFNPNQTFPGHIGMQSMRERAESMGGTLTVHSQPMQGTQIVAVLPAILSHDTDKRMPNAAHGAAIDEADSAADAAPRMAAMRCST